jgi:hypothetical protein
LTNHTKNKKASRETPAFYLPGMNDKSVIFELEMGEDWTEVNMVSFVENPAIRAPFLKFSEQENPFRFQAIEDRQIVTGPVLIPDLVIPRKIEQVLFNVVFRADQIDAIYEKFMATSSFRNTNFMHQLDQSTTDKCHLYETFISDKERGIQPPVGFEDHPDKTWYMSYRITDKELWTKIKAGEINGYSIEGNFKMVAPKEDQDSAAVLQVLDELAEILK